MAVRLSEDQQAVLAEHALPSRSSLTSWPAKQGWRFGQPHGQWSVVDRAGPIELSTGSKGSVIVFGAAEASVRVLSVR